MSKWVLKKIGADYAGISKELGVDPVIVRLMVNRGIAKEDMKTFLELDMSRVLGYEGLKDIDKAVGILVRLKEEGTSVRVIGDYDIDGICASAILLKGLKLFGIDASYAIPHRVTDGYGLNINLIDGAIKDNVGAIITCDNGISAVDEIKYAKENNITVIVTDHHEPVKVEDEWGILKDVYPPADAIINPKREDDEYGFREICGAFVAFKLMSALNDFKEIDDISGELLELAAFATVGDIMPLCGENRNLVRWGVTALNNPRNLGMTELIKCKMPGKTVSEYHIGFVLGPCINATGRLESADRALSLLMCEDEGEAADKACELALLNEKRKEITEEFTAKAIEDVARKYNLADGDTDIPDKVLVVYLKECHESLAGIIAGRLREKFERPTFVFTDSNNCVKGSGRSVECYDMHGHLLRVSDILLRFGGHKMAAGLSLEEDKVPLFAQRINEDCEVPLEDMVDIMYVDADMPLSYVTQDLIEQLDLLKPFGVANEKPKFARAGLRILSARTAGRERKMAIFDVEENNVRYTMKYFGDVALFNEYIDAKYGAGCAEGLYNRIPISLNVIYTPEINEYNGKREIQFIMNNYS